jgi:anti-sigma factor RsiW
MSDVASHLTPAELAELCALADGTLSDERRADVEAWVDASPELQELLERQRRAVLASRTLASDEHSPSLQAAVDASRAALGSRRRQARLLRPRFALAAALVAATAVVAAVVLNGGPGAPTVADAARLAAESPTEPAPRAGSTGTQLAIGVDRVAFPDLADAFGWRAVGVRRGRIDGREATVVSYAKGDRRIAYAIVSGRGLARPSGGDVQMTRGVSYQALRLNDRLVVTWRRGGHTCVLIGDAPRAELLALASWPVGPAS